MHIMATKSVNKDQVDHHTSRVELDVAIIGGGPAAMTAALYLARAGRQVRVYERGSLGGALMEIGHIANYPGYTGSGKDLAERLHAQAQAAGAEFAYGECTDISPSADGFGLTIDDEIISARAVLVATGSEPRKLGFEIEPPVSYCVLCDSDLAKGQKVAVIGGANSAVQESLQLAPLVKSLTLISHSPLKADQCLQNQLTQQPNVEIRENLEPDAELLAEFERVFVFIGKQPATSCLGELRSPDLCDAQGYLLTGQDGASTHQTRVPGLFAAGDVRSGVVRQVITAAGDGAAAAVEIGRYLQGR